MCSNHQSDRKRTLCDQAVQVFIIRALNAQVSPANVVDGLIVHHEAAVGMLKSSVRGKDGVVRLHDGSGNLRGGIDAELQLAFFAVVDGEALHEKGTESGTGAATEGVKHQETLQTRAIVCNTANLVQDLVNEFLADRIVASGVVVGCILFSSDHVFGVEKLAVGTGADLVDHIGLQIAVDGSRYIFALTYETLRQYWPLSLDLGPTYQSRRKRY